MELKVIELAPDHTHVALVGTLDLQAAGAIDTEFHRLVSARRVDAVIDMSELEFMASLGVGLVVGCAASLKRRGARMVLVNPSASITKVLRVTNAEALLHIVDSIDDARALLATAAT